MTSSIDSVSGAILQAGLDFHIIEKSIKTYSNEHNITRLSWEGITADLKEDF